MIHEAKRKREEEISYKILDSSLKKKGKGFCDPLKKSEKVDSIGINLKGVPLMEPLLVHSNAQADPLGTFDPWVI